MYPSMKLINFMNQRRTSESNCTHTGLAIPLIGKYFVPDHEMNEFWEIYENAKQQSKEKNIQFGISLTECPTRYIPLLIDVDIRQTDLNRKYTRSDIINLMKLYRRAIHNVLVVDDSKLIATVLEKPSPRVSNEKFKDGFHVHFMDVIVDKEVHKKIHEMVIEFLNEDNYLQHLGSPEEIIDINVIRNNWFVYASRKSDDMHCYTVTGYVNEHNEFIENDKEVLAKDLSIRNREMVLEKKHVQEQIMSEHHVEFKPNERISSLLNMLNIERCDNYKNWMEVGWCLHNIDKGLLPLWISWSQQSDKFVTGECEKRWENFRDDGLTIASLYKWANDDNPTEYLEFRRKDSESLLMRALSKTSYDVAVYLHYRYKETFACSCIQRMEWYHFENHRWVENEDGYKLTDKMSTEMAYDVSKLHTYYTKKQINERNMSEKEADKIDKNIKRCTSLIQSLKDYTFKRKVLKECCSLFYDNKFKETLDTKTHLIGFNNGIYDISQLEFRDGRSEDYISLNTNTDYHKMNVKDEGLRQFLHSILPDLDMRRYVLKLLASFLDGSTRDQKFHLWTGSGANGKSTLIELFELCLGEYCCKLPITLLTKKRNASNAASPEVHAAKSKRFASMQEPDDGDRINVGYMKELSGGDKTYSRGLYEKPIEFKPQFKMILTCNKLPEIQATDDGTWRRLRVVPFESKFVDNPDPRNKHEYKKDRSICDKMKEWVAPFIDILIDALEDYKQTGIEEPDTVTQYTANFQRTSDIMGTYFKETIDQTNDPSDTIDLRTFYHHFKAWYRAGVNNNPPQSKEFKEYLEAIQKYPKNNKGWYQGIRINTEHLEQLN